MQIKSSPLFDIDEDVVETRAAYAPYPQAAFGSPLVLTASRRSGNRSVSAPYFGSRDNGVDSDDDEVEQTGILPAVRLTRPGLRSIKSVDSFPLTKSDSGLPMVQGCSVCSASSITLSSLSPCGHVICSSCLTGALNIIGEKDMRCATCDAKVVDFKLLAPVSGSPTSRKECGETSSEMEYASVDPLPTDNHDSLLPSAFDGDEPHTGNKHFEVVQPLPAGFKADPIATQSGITTNSADPTVLRIDNVPWVCCMYFSLSYAANNVPGYHSSCTARLFPSLCCP